MKEVTVEIIKKDMAKVFELATQAGVLEACIRATTEAKTLSPVAQINGGRLRNSIMYKMQDKKGGFNNSGGEKASKEITPEPQKLEGYVGSNLEYAVYQEFGTRKMRPQPFLRPAILFVQKGNVQDVIKRIKEETERGILKAGQKRETFR